MRPSDAAEHQRGQSGGAGEEHMSACQHVSILPSSLRV
jgi:hypothetical protein